MQTGPRAFGAGPRFRTGDTSIGMANGDQCTPRPPTAPAFPRRSPGRHRLPDRVRSLHRSHTSHSVDRVAGLPGTVARIRRDVTRSTATIPHRNTCRRAEQQCGYHDAAVGVEKRRRDRNIVTAETHPLYSQTARNLREAIPLRVHRPQPHRPQSTPSSRPVETMIRI